MDKDISKTIERFVRKHDDEINNFSDDLENHA